MDKIFTEECLHSIDNKFNLILLAVHRTREILNSEDISVLQKNYDLYSAETISLFEIAHNKLDIKVLHNSLLDKMINEYRENYLIQSIGLQGFDRDTDPQKMIKDIFKDELSSTDQDQNPDQSLTSEQQQKSHNNNLEDDVISKVIQMGYDSDKD